MGEKGNEIGLKREEREGEEEMDLKGEERHRERKLERE